MGTRKEHDYTCQIAWTGTEKQLFAERGQGMQVNVTVRGASPARVTELVRAVPGVQSAELVQASEPGETIVTTQVTADSDVRDAVCRALVKADVSVLELRGQGLEGMVLELLGGDPGELDANANGHGRSRFR